MTSPSDRRPHRPGARFGAGPLPHARVHEPPAKHQSRGRRAAAARPARAPRNLRRGEREPVPVLRPATLRSARRSRPAPGRALLIERPRAPSLRAIGHLRLPRCSHRVSPRGRPGGHRRLREHAHLARRPPRRLSPGAPPARAAHDLRPAPVTAAWSSTPLVSASHLSLRRACESFRSTLLRILRSHAGQADASVGKRGPRASVVCQQPPVVPSAQFGDRRRSRQRDRRDYRNRGKPITPSGGGARLLAVDCDHPAIRGAVIAFVTERSCRPPAWLLRLGDCRTLIGDVGEQEPTSALRAGCSRVDRS